MIASGTSVKHYQESKCLGLEVNSRLVVSFISLPGALCEHRHTHGTFTVER